MESERRLAGAGRTAGMVGVSMKFVPRFSEIVVPAM
jgi:hypothetical protein